MLPIVNKATEVYVFMYGRTNKNNENNKNNIGNKKYID